MLRSEALASPELTRLKPRFLSQQHAPLLALEKRAKISKLLERFILATKTKLLNITTRRSKSEVKVFLVLSIITYKYFIVFIE